MMLDKACTNVGKIFFKSLLLESGAEDTAVGEAAQGRRLLERFDDATHHGTTSTFRPVKWS